ncbi:hypothetical protein [Blastochloris tepida]|jgi:hypothetical protein|uniref:Uncharacterized protein n=1 Tax=Blastochloris tepida TaxID=2233851 RepID=A0A348G2F4_9HYPH|nr:hypothetical protein [Blastochloris tepida]BBF93737.1 hypothetical protein BLTE_24220 [Blastochloris tepida]
MRRWAAIVAVVAALCPLPADASPRGIIYMGLGDELFAGPLLKLKAELERRGAIVEMRPWWSPSSEHYDFAIGQSFGVGPASKADADRRIGIDPVQVDWAGIQVNFWTPPKLGYAPGRPLSNARNIRVDEATHVSLPEVAATRIADEALPEPIPPQPILPPEGEAPGEPIQLIGAARASE